ncbi:MAG TPA: biotin--[acetyl-CoA-carboxylase] ligase [Chthoniobacterales bacterium]|jgi:BirA family biotin operon repressor/biotin-[acetyl-CoA-carboxylase] ligase
MTAGRISSLLTSRIIGRPTRVYQELTSTNDLASQLGNEGAPEGFAIFAETQTKGRGRLGRSWQSTAGDSLSFSILLRPSWPDISRMSLAAACAVARALDNLTDLPVGIKWPNDIYIDGRKVAGILCEAGKQFLVVGIGLNVFQQVEDFPEELRERAGSLAMFANKEIDRAELAASILDALDRIYLTLPDGFTNVKEECQRRSVLLNREIAVEMGCERVTGTVTGLDGSGALRVLQASGEEILVSAGEVTLLTV